MECLSKLTTTKLYLFFFLRPAYGVGLYTHEKIIGERGKLIPNARNLQILLRKVLHHRHFSGVILKIFRTTIFQKISRKLILSSLEI